jgi:hypothetical protein
VATIRFPDGNTKNARYSTVVEAVLSDSHRDVPAGDLIPVTVTVGPDARTWHAVADAVSGDLVGPESDGPDIDLFAHREPGTVRRDCLVAMLPSSIHGHGRQRDHH